MSKLSENPRGSKPTEPMRPSVLDGLRRKGTDFDISALRAVDAYFCLSVCACLHVRKRREEK